jgi:hypothetical protein
MTLAACAHPQHKVIFGKDDCVMSLAWSCHFIVALHTMHDPNSLAVSNTNKGTPDSPSTLSSASQVEA